MSRPLVSVIMPVYNGEKYVAAAIDSVLAQSYSNIELILVNDGSTDDTERIVAAYTDPRIRYLRQENRGVSSARNQALALMKGQLLCFLDADDVLPEESISGRLECFDSDPTVYAVDGTVEVYDETMTRLVRTWQPSFSGDVTDSLLRLQPRCFFSLTWLIRVDPGHRYYFHEDMTHAEDLLFLVDISTMGKYEFVNETTYRYRASPGSAMSNIDGLARGYAQLYERMTTIYGDRMSIWGKVTLATRIRKIVFLCYLRSGRALKAFRYLFNPK